MKPLHKIALVCTTFILAAATGHVMQNSARFGLTSDQVPPPMAGTPQSPAEPVALAAEPEVHVAQVPGLTAPAPRLQVVETDTVTLPQDDPAPATGFAQPACAAPTLSAASAPSASVQLTLEAPCLSGQWATIRHEGLTLPIRLSTNGDWSGLVPAMAPEARLSVALPDGTQLNAVQAVTGLANLNRYVLSAEGPAALQLHGYEYGSGAGGEGDVSAAMPRTADTPLGGWMAVFDDPEAGTQVQIYSAPAEMADIRLQAEAEITPQSCGKDLRAQAQRLLKGSAEAPAPITLAMPDCGDGEGVVVMALPDFPLNVAAN